ncbi:MAG: hypothetical protein FJ109_20630 [Deltaproteobacteria bacterium]|nr:hypothetical protein [Deltaproteobacteria bacterium]
MADRTTSKSPTRGRLLLLFSHELLPEQESDARASLGVREIVPLPPDLLRLWQDVPADSADIADYLAPVIDWLRQLARPGDLVLVQGDFGATWLAVNKVVRLGAVAIYATTVRESHEAVTGDGSVVKSSRFRHVRFRRYETVED